MLGCSLLIRSIQEYSYRCPNGLAALVDRVLREEAIATGIHARGSALYDSLMWALY